MWDFDSGNAGNVFARRSYDFIVVGIFEAVITPSTGSDSLDAEIIHEINNRVYVPNLVSLAVHAYQIEQMRAMMPDEEFFQRDIEDTIWYQSVYVLHNPHEIDSFKAGAKEILPEFYTIIGLSDANTDIFLSLENLQNLSTFALRIAIFAILFVMSLVVIMSVRERRREIAIYFALGESKVKIAAQILVEALTVATVAILLSLVAGLAFSSTVSEDMLRSDLASIQGDDGGVSALEMIGFDKGFSAEEALAQYDTSLNATAVFVTFLVSMGTILTATLAPIFYIMRVSPRKILM